MRSSLAASSLDFQAALLGTGFYNTAAAGMHLGHWILVGTLLSPSEGHRLRGTQVAMNGSQRELRSTLHLLLNWCHLSGGEQTAAIQAYPSIACTFS